MTSSIKFSFPGKPVEGNMQVRAISVDEPTILNAVVDQHQARWLRYGTATSSVWFSLQELHLNEKEVFARLSRTGKGFLLNPAKNSFKKVIDDHTDYHHAIVAAHPGWCGNTYVFGDGTVRAPQTPGEDIIVAFEIDPKFTPVGSLETWTAGIGEIVAKQSLPLFVLSYAFLGPILRFASQGTLNPQIELVGPPETGKTSIAVMAASVWAGDPDNDAGGGENWNATLGNLDLVRAAHNDTLLLLDEANLAGSTPRDLGQLLHKTVFRMAATEGRRRMGDTGATPNIRVALLSTSNEPLRRLVQTSGPVADAIASRMVSVAVEKRGGLGVFDSIPEEYANVGETARALRLVCAQNYGRAGRVFVRKLVDEAFRDKEALVSRIDGYVDDFKASLDDDPVKGAGSDRIRHTFAITYAAGMLAREWGLLPEEWGNLKKRLRRTYDAVQRHSHVVPARRSAVETIRDYVQRKSDSLISIAGLARPVKYKRFKTAAGFILERDGRKYVLIPTEKFKSEFEESGALMTELRSTGRAKTEKGKKPKLSVKSPKQLCAKGRVYWIRIS